MPLVIGAEIVAVNNADGVVEPQAVPEAQTAFGENKKNPAFGYTRSDACRNGGGFARRKFDRHGSEKIIAGRA